MSKELFEYFAIFVCGVISGVFIKFLWLNCSLASVFIA